MASNSHLKRHASPTAWPIKRKNITFVAKPKPGSHKLKYVTPLVVVLRDVLKYAETSKEVKLIINSSEVLVNGKQVKNVKFPVGMFDVLELKKTNEKYVVLFDNFGKIKLVATKTNEVLLKVSGKKQLVGGKYQLNFMNGFNILVDEKDAKSTKVNDTVVFDFIKRKAVKTLSLKAGVFAYFFDGKFRGSFGEIKEFVEYKGLTRDVVKVQIGDNVETTAKEYAFVVGTKKDDLKGFE